jgi:hypothetical protein
MGSSKPQEHGMNACETSLSLMALKSEKLILLSSLKLLQKTCLYAKSMSSNSKMAPSSAKQSTFKTYLRSLE